MRKNSRTVKVISLPTHLRDALTNTYFTVIARFERGLYLQGDSRLFYVTAADRGNPLSVEISRQDLAQIEVGPDRQAISFSVDLKTRSLDLRLKDTIETARLAAIKSAIEQVAAPSGIDGRETSFKESMARLHAFNAFLDPTAIVGRGAGLTPAGDDVLVGMLFVLFARGERGRIDHLKNTLDRSRTTTISAAFIEYALQGYFPRSLLRLSEDSDIEAAIHEALSYGHSSGADTLLGVAYAIGELTSTTRT